MNPIKRTFVQNLQSMATGIATMTNSLEDLEAVWNARQYGPGGTDAITDAELAEMELSGGRGGKADDLYGFIILCSQFNKFMNGQVAAVSSYNATVNKIRLDI